MSISVKKTNDECNLACGAQGECPPDVSKVCKCGDDVLDYISEAQKAEAARQKRANEDYSGEGYGKEMEDEAAAHTMPPIVPAAEAGGQLPRA